MTAVPLAINGRLEEGETLLALVSHYSDYGLQWQANVDGYWINVGAVGSASLVVPPGAEGTSYRLMLQRDGQVFFSDATLPVVVDTKHANAPVISGWSPYLMTIIEEPHPVFERIFSRAGFSDADKHSYRGGTLDVLNSNSIDAGGDGHDTLFVRFDGTGLRQLSYEATTREIGYTDQAGDFSVIGCIDAELDGAGDNLRIAFTKGACAEAINALIDRLGIANYDETPLDLRLLTLRITDPDGAVAQACTAIPFESAIDPVDPAATTLVGIPDAY